MPGSATESNPGRSQMWYALYEVSHCLRFAISLTPKAACIHTQKSERTTYNLTSNITGLRNCTTICHPLCVSDCFVHLGGRKRTKADSGPRVLYRAQSPLSDHIRLVPPELCMYTLFIDTSLVLWPIKPASNIKKLLRCIVIVKMLQLTQCSL